jgi:2-amino-4-hydroxy-6-hydroxymethyldihydropteridine diphosphokinase
LRAFLGLGSNLGDRWAYLREAVASLPDVAAVSPVYETSPVGGPEGQGPYLNCVVELSTELSPRELLEVAQRLEAAAVRERGERWGPRTLDVDVLLVDDLTVDEPDLVVVAPLADLAPELVPEGWEARLAGDVTPAGRI